MLTPLHLKDVCLMGTGSSECRYLATSMTGSCMCFKKSPGKKKILDEQVEEFIKKVTEKGGDPEAMGRGLADNCKGYLPLGSIPQGHDVPGSV